MPSLRQLLLRSLDDQLTPAEADRLAEALRQEPWLQKEADNWREFRGALRELHPAPRPDFVQRVMTALPAPVARVITLQRLWPVAIAASLLALVVAAGWVFTTSGSVDKDAVLGLDELTTDDVYVLNNW